jgi:hypothetical protein
VPSVRQLMGKKTAQRKMDENATQVWPLGKPKKKLSNLLKDILAPAPVELGPTSKSI